MPIIIILIYYGRYGWTLLIFCVAAVTDGIDGIIARKFNQKSWLGTLLDPIADKFLITTSFLLLTFGPRLYLPMPPWVTVLVIFRDIIIVAGAGALEMFTHRLKIVPTPISKLTTVCQSLFIIYVILANHVIALNSNAANALSQPLLVSAIIISFLTIVSGLQYVRIGTRTLQDHSIRENTHEPDKGKNN